MIREHRALTFLLILVFFLENLNVSLRVRLLSECLECSL